MKLAAALAVFLGALGYIGFKLLGPFGRARRGAGSAATGRARRRTARVTHRRGRD